MNEGNLNKSRDDDNVWAESWIHEKKEPVNMASLKLRLEELAAGNTTKRKHDHSRKMQELAQLEEQKNKLTAGNDESPESDQTHLMMKEMLKHVIAEEVRILQKYQTAVAAPIYRCEKYVRIVSNLETTVAAHPIES